MLVNIVRHPPIAIIELNHPPVNGLGLALRTSLVEAFETLTKDPDIVTIVITGSGRMFSAGADIREFGKTESRTAPLLPDVIKLIELSAKPVVAAIHGNALGGGLELALGCSYRIATHNTKFGLPEVSLGIIPGAGGTQRLPRIIGLKPALDMIVTGKIITSKEALDIGLVDHIVDTEIIDETIKFCSKALNNKAITPITRNLKIQSDNNENIHQLFDDYKNGMTKTARNLKAPYIALDCVKASVEKQFEEGLSFEREKFRELVTSEQSKALRHAFFSERQSSKTFGHDSNIKPNRINRAAVVGCGTMGAGIAMNFANAGIPVTILETSTELKRSGLERIRMTYAHSVARRRITQEKMDICMNLIDGITSYNELKTPDVVIEAVFEDLKLKKEIFKKLDYFCPPETILASNTSFLNINEIAAVTSRAEKVIGTHFFSPANVMRLQENVRGKMTSEQTVTDIMALSKTLGKIGVLVGVCDGFVGNRMLYAYTRQANFLLEEGALPEQIDKAIYDFGFPMGPFSIGDLAGLDIGWMVRKNAAASRPTNLRYSTIADRICELGRFGQKTSAGWYKYEQGSRTPIPDKKIEDLIISISSELGYSRRKISNSEIIERCMYALINEGAKILSEGIAQRSSDIDTIWIHGYGFPRQRGGPMYYADTVGLEKIYNKLQSLYTEHGEWLKPAPLLKELASSGKRFGDL